MFVYLDTSKMECRIYRRDLYNLKIRKRSAKIQTVQKELSVNSNTTMSQI